MDEGYALSLAQLRDYGCLAHPHGQCPSRPVFLPITAPFNPSAPDQLYCVPAIPAPADQLFPSPPFGAEAEAEQVRLQFERAQDEEAERAVLEEMAQAVDAQGASAAPMSVGEQAVTAFPPTDVEQTLAARGCNFGPGPWGVGQQFYGPPGSCLTHPPGTCMSRDPASFLVDRRRRQGVPAPLAVSLQPAVSSAPEPEPHSPDSPPPEWLAEIRERGCDFGVAPWREGTTHMGPPGTCLVHRFGDCPSQNPFSYYIDRRRRLGLPYHTSQNRGANRNQTRRSRAVKSAALKRRAATPKFKRTKRGSNMKKKTKRRSSTRRQPFDMSALAQALGSSAEGEMEEEELSRLLRAARISKKKRSTRKK